MILHADRIKPDSYAITTYLDNLTRGQYQIPTFQRNVVWERSRVKRLWDSILKFYPLGSILVWRTEIELQNHREIGGHELTNGSSANEFQYLLDGQQRTTALLTSVYGGRIKGQARDPSLYVDLTIEDKDEIDDESWNNRFLFWDEIDDDNGRLRRNIGRKKRFDEGLIVKLRDIAQNYSMLERQLVSSGYEDYDNINRRQLRLVKQVFDTYKLSFIELRGIDVAEVCQIFERVNQAGQPLSMFDIVVAKTFRPESKDTHGFYLRGILEEFRSGLDGSFFSSVDNLTLLQILAILVRDSVPDSRVYNITDRYLNVLRTRHLESVLEDGKKAILKVFDFFGNHLKLPGPALVPYRYFYMTLASYFFRNDNPDYPLLTRYFWYHSLHNDDLLSNTTHLREHITRLKESRSYGEYRFERFQVDRERLRKETYSNRGRLSRAILSLYANQCPCDWKYTSRAVFSPVYYYSTDRPNLHHIFPIGFCKNHLEPSNVFVDSLLNIAYLTQITNLEISNKNPLVYMRNYMDGRHRIQITHLLPEVIFEWANKDQMPDDALDTFVEERLGLIIGEIKEKLDGMRIDVIDTQSTDIG